MASDIYAHLDAQNENRLMLFHRRGFTTEIPEEEYKKLLALASKKKGAAVSEDRFTIKNIARLQEGIPVIDADKPLKLLVDDPRSIMNHLYGTCTYILREYEIS